jgi:hypothetical protein
MIEINLPHKFEPREYQLPLMEAIDNGYKRLIYVAHRRAGKDKTIWNITIKEAFKRVGTYYYILPTYSQAKKVIWDSIDKDGFKMMNHLPDKLIRNKNETEMQIELVNGSIIQLVGSDNVDRIVGTNPIGVVFSEYSICKPEVWNFLRPILAENGGWAIFNFTPRGMNHAYTLLQMAKESPDWWVGIYPVSVTKALTPQALSLERKEMPRATYEQEYECKFLETGSQFFKKHGLHTKTDTWPQLPRKRRGRRLLEAVAWSKQKRGHFSFAKKQMERPMNLLRCQKALLHQMQPKNSQKK